MAEQICLKFGMGGDPPQGNIHSKNCLFLFRARHYQAMDAWKCCHAFLVPACIIHTHTCILAAQPTIVLMKNKMYPLALTPFQYALCLILWINRIYTDPLPCQSYTRSSCHRVYMPKENINRNLHFSWACDQLVANYSYQKIYAMKKFEAWVF